MQTYRFCYYIMQAVAKIAFRKGWSSCCLRWALSPLKTRKNLYPLFPTKNSADFKQHQMQSNISEFMHRSLI